MLAYADRRTAVEPEGADQSRTLNIAGGMAELEKIGRCHHCDLRELRSESLLQSRCGSLSGCLHHRAVLKSIL